MLDVNTVEGEESPTAAADGVSPLGLAELAQQLLASLANVKPSPMREAYLNKVKQFFDGHLK